MKQVNEHPKKWVMFRNPKGKNELMLLVQYHIWITADEDLMFEATVPLDGTVIQVKGAANFSEFWRTFMSYCREIAFDYLLCEWPEDQIFTTDAIQTETRSIVEG